MNTSKNPDNNRNSLVSTLKNHFSEKKFIALNQAVNAIIKQVSTISGKPFEEVEKHINRLEVKGGNDNGGDLTETIIVSKEKPDHHGPLSPIIPHECHIGMRLCNPLPFGPQVCVDIELPWPCPDVVFEPGPWD